MTEPEPTTSPEEKKARWANDIVKNTEDFWRKNRARTAARNLAYTRGDFWRSSGIGGVLGDIEKYSAQRNEISPIVDTIVSRLAVEQPAVDAIDRRLRSGSTVPTRENDRVMVGRRVARALNYFAEQDQLEVEVQRLVLLAAMFDEGATAKTSWNTNHQRVVWRALLPWDCHHDPNARRIEDANWSFERFTLHIDDLRSRVEDGTYDLRKAITADVYPCSLIEDEMADDTQDRRKRGLREFVSMVEFWDYRAGKFYHLHPSTGQMLMSADMGWRRPYTRLVFRDDAVEAGGVSDVSLCAPTQRDINELVSARREIVQRLPRRMLIDPALFKDDKDFERFKNSRSWEPTPAEPPPDGFEGRVWVTPAMDTTYDFNAQLKGDVEEVRWVSGVNEHDRGQSRNIRTAEEAKMIQGGDEGRMKIRSKRLEAAVRDMFAVARDVLRWAVRSPDASKIDLQHLWDETQLDVPFDQFADELANASTSFKLLPFNAIMDNPGARRDTLVDLMPALTSPGLADHINLGELVQELIEQMGWRPSIAKEAAPPAPPGVPGMGGAAGLPPDLAAAVGPPPEPPPGMGLPPGGMPPGVNPLAMLGALAGNGQTPAIA